MIAGFLVVADIIPFKFLILSNTLQRTIFNLLIHLDRLLISTLTLDIL